MFTIEFIACLLGGISVVGSVVTIVVRDNRGSLKATEASRDYLLGQVPTGRN